MGHFFLRIHSVLCLRFLTVYYDICDKLFKEGEGLSEKLKYTLFFSPQFTTNGRVAGIWDKAENV